MWTKYDPDSMSGAAEDPETLKKCEKERKQEKEDRKMKKHQEEEEE